MARIHRSQNLSQITCSAGEANLALLERALAPCRGIATLLIAYEDGVADLCLDHFMLSLG